MNSKDWRPTAFVDTAPGVVTEQDAGTWRLDQRRTLPAFIRHLMTLATLALVLTVTLIEKAFAAHRKEQESCARRLAAHSRSAARPFRAARAERGAAVCAGRLARPAGRCDLRRLRRRHRCAAGFLRQRFR
jgi:hypothetical protein